MRVWFEGKLHQGPLGISPRDRGLTLGDGIFETLLVQQGVAVFREDHLDRMKSSAEILGIRFPEKAINEAIDGMCKNVVALHVLRLTLTRGVTPRGLAEDSDKPYFFATIDQFDASQQFKFITLYEAQTRRNEFSTLSMMKCLSYMDNIYAAREAKAFGADEALILNTKGRLACTSIGNIFIVAGGELITPKLSEGALPGIMRHHVLQAADRLGIKTKEVMVNTRLFSHATTVFVTNSLRIMSMVVELNGSPVPFEDMEMIKRVSKAIVDYIRFDIDSRKI